MNPLLWPDLAGDYTEFQTSEQGLGPALLPYLIVVNAGLVGHWVPSSNFNFELLFGLVDKF